MCYVMYSFFSLYLYVRADSGPDGNFKSFKQTCNYSFKNYIVLKVDIVAANL